nr:PREDICTED: prorelaxin H2 [Latimeria chalumnae]|eukprot:XP_006008815.1 PREDICTED: prorelaxin H2 [Latimeria chalumnae]
MFKVTMIQLLCVWVLLSSFPGYLDAEVGGGGQGKKRVKLCGRDFIRNVIFTCGRHRWRSVFLDLEAPSNTDSFQSTSDVDLEKFKSLQIDSSQLQTSGLPSGQESMEDLLSLYEDHSEFVPTTNSFDEYVHKVEVASRRLRNENGVFTTPGSNNFPWDKSPRRKRSFPTGLVDKCCKSGCTRKEIKRFC